VSTSTSSQTSSTKSAAVTSSAAIGEASWCEQALKAQHLKQELLQQSMASLAAILKESEVDPIIVANRAPHDATSRRHRKLRRSAYAEHSAMLASAGNGVGSHPVEVMEEGEGTADRPAQEKQGHRLWAVMKAILCSWW
jgi:hypothetical protein